MQIKNLLAGVFLSISLSTVFSQEYSFTPDILVPSETQEFGLAGGFELVISGEITSREFLDFSYTSEYFGFIAATTLNQDGKYSPLIAHLPDGTLFNSYLTMDQGGMVFRGMDMELQFGRLEHYDVIDSPYSLFISSKRNPALLANFRYENGFAFYETRWMELNNGSAADTPAFPNGYPDRGAHLKTYGIKLGNMRFGYQDAAVYAGKFFDFEYFVSPMPNYIIQYVKGTEGRPWNTGVNENNIMGFFWDWKPDENTYFDAQLLVDDLSGFGIGGIPNNPMKAAYTIGGKLKTPVGTFGIHHALATKYTFNRTSDTTDNDYEYSYTYYPDSWFKMSDGDLKPITIEENMIGYYNGENNIAFRLDYDGSVSGIKIVSSLEFILSGPKSPTNAWHENPRYLEPGTQLFDYSILEKKLVLEAQASRRFGDFLAFVNLRAGIAINALELQEPYPEADETEVLDTINDDIWIWRPGDDNEYTLSFGLGIRYDIPVMKSLGKR
jgi:hypothetical protein